MLGVIVSEAQELGQAQRSSGTLLLHHLYVLGEHQLHKLQLCISTPLPLVVLHQPGTPPAKSMRRRAGEKPERFNLLELVSVEVANNALAFWNPMYVTAKGLSYATTHYCRKDWKRSMKMSMHACQPLLRVLVPRMYEKMYEKIIAGLVTASLIKRALFTFVTWVGLEHYANTRRDSAPVGAGEPRALRRPHKAWHRLRCLRPTRVGRRSAGGHGALAVLRSQHERDGRAQQLRARRGEPGVMDGKLIIGEPGVMDGKLSAALLRNGKRMKKRTSPSPNIRRVKRSSKSMPMKRKNQMGNFRNKITKSQN